MCSNVKYVYNRYVGKTLIVDCGKCPSCQQSKAATRASRIRNNVRDGEISLFVTLTYDNRFVPYIRRSELCLDGNTVNVYRDASCRYHRVGKRDSYQQSLFVDDGIKVLGSASFDVDSQLQIDRLLSVKPSKFDAKDTSDMVGVCWYSDVKNFFKRLRQVLKRHYGYSNGFSYFACSEYGSFTQRPHFHLLIYIPKDFEQTFRSAIVESWPFADKDRTARFVEVARDCASYVSSYVNSSSDVSQILQTSCFKQKHSYSKVFGMGLHAFSLDEVLQKTESGDLRYYSKVVRDGVPSVSSYPIPKYVINRYFPIFKGYSRIDVDTLASLLQDPTRLYKHYPLRTKLGLSEDDVKRFVIRQNHAYDYYHRVTGGNRYDYAIDFERVWRCRKSVCLRDSLLEVDDVTIWPRYYDNFLDLHFSIVRNDTLKEICEAYPAVWQDNPNLTYPRLLRTVHLEEIYNKCNKQRRVTNYIMSNGLNLNV